MEIKSSLLNQPELEQTKKSLIDISQNDNKGDFRVKAIEYIADTSEYDGDDFFYDMMEFIRFLNPNDKAVAYTDPYKIIWMNIPGHIGEKLREWDFIYDHECLHQLWDTFGVKDKIIKAGREYNHDILNIASDCVINDYLYISRKKTRPDGLITPEFLKEKFGVEYDRKKDTQYSLYCKLLDKQKEILNDPDIQENMKKFEGTIKPKSINKNSGGGGGQMPEQKHSESYKRGWEDAIQDVLDKKLDPTDPNLTPKKTSDDEYDKGYNDCTKEIKGGLENGLEMSDSKGGGQSPKSDLAKIPWETPPQSSNGGSDSDSSDNNQQNSDNSERGQKDADDAQKSAADAAAAADAAQKAADAAKKAAKNSSSNDMKDAAKAAQDAANRAKEAANSAADAAKKAASAAKNGNEETEAAEAQRAADNAKMAGEAAKDAAEAARGMGDKDAQDAAEQAQNAGEQAVDNNSTGEGNSSDKNNSKGSQGKGAKQEGERGEYMSDIDLEEIKNKATELIEKYKNKLTGNLADFLEKCHASTTLQKSGLVTGADKGMRGWDQKLANNINTFVKNKIFQKRRQFQKTYKRPNRRGGFIKPGQTIQPGKKVKEQTMPLNAAFYIDQSGSMGYSMENVFDACYEICEGLKKRFGKDKTISDVFFKIYTFEYALHEIPFGKRVHANGGTMELDTLLKHIADKSKDYLINVIITDAEFSDINAAKRDMKKLLNDIPGMLNFIINNEEDMAMEVKNMAKQFPCYTSLR